jgi:hypothetical protein
MDLITNIERQLARGRHRDLAQVIDLIRSNQLDESFAQQLTPSLREGYNHCLEQTRLEDEWEKNQDAFEEKAEQ